MAKNSYENLSEKNKILFLAGLFDGEGSFGIWGKGNGRKSFQCGIEMCDKDILDRFSDFFGGNVMKVRIRKPNWTQTWRWRLSGTRAYECIDILIEYMCLRRQEKYYNVVKRDKISRLCWK
jgi:hypothetical protein